MTVSSVQFGNATFYIKGEQYRPNAQQVERRMGLTKVQYVETSNNRDLGNFRIQSQGTKAYDNRVQEVIIEEGIPQDAFTRVDL